MTNKPNCGNCPDKRCVWKDIPDIRYATKSIGCLSHPGAREWLMKDILEKLEVQLKHNGITIYYIPQIIDLIRGDKK